MKKLFLVILVCFVNLNIAYSQIKGFANNNEISEVITSTELKIKSNAIPFFDSKTLPKECKNKFIWYKIVFSKKSSFSFCLIPNKEQDLYTVEAFRTRGEQKICDSVNYNTFVIPNLLVKKTYTNTEQSASFRSTTLYSTNVQVNEDESIYILIYNLKGTDLGHVLGVKTPHGEYVFKTTKDTARYTADCNAIINQDMSFNVIKNELCDDNLRSNLFGRIKFEDNKFVDANLTRKDIKKIIDIAAIDKILAIEEVKPLTPLTEKKSVPTKGATISQTVTASKTQSNSEVKKNITAPIIPTVSVTPKTKTEEVTSNAQVLKQNDSKPIQNKVSVVIENKVKEPESVIYKIKIPQFTNDSNKVLAIPTIRSQTTNEIIDNIKYINKNELEVRLKKNEKYNLEFNVLGYKKYTNFISSEFSKDSINKLDVVLVPLKEGEVFVFKNISFFPNTPVIKKGSENELLKLTSFLKECPHISISIEGHTNGNAKIPEDRERTLRGGAWAFHGSAKELSIERAKVIQSYLVERGIDISRLAIVGFGGKKPIDDIMDPEESYRNMRVEIRIVKSLPK